MCNKRYRFSANRRRQDSGAVTIEFAIVLTGIVALLAAVLLLLSAALTTWRCINVAHTGARMQAIGEPVEKIEQLARQTLGPAARVDIERGSKWVTVSVSAPVPVSPFAWKVEHSSHAYLEPTEIPVHSETGN